MGKKKCKACKYKGPSESPIVGEAFIRIHCAATIDVDSSMGAVMPHRVSLYACPKCFTVQMEKW